MNGKCGKGARAVLAASVLAAAFAMFSATAADFKSPKLRNEGFESGLSEWEGAGDGWRVADGEGRGKSRALVCEGAANAGPSQTITLDRGSKYRFGAWVRTTSLGKDGKPVSPKIVLTWYDWNDNPRGSVEAVVAGDNDPNPEGWVRYEGVAVPTCGPYGKISIAPPGEPGARIVVDDFYHILDGGKTVGDLVSNAYRNKRDSGRVKFAVALNVNTLEHPLAGLKPVFEFVGADGKKFARSPDAFAADKAVVEMDVERLQKGRSDVVFTLNGADGKSLGDAKYTFFRIPLGKRRVSFDNFNRTLVDGKPFFPLGMFAAHVDENMVKRYCQGPFNCILTYDYTDKVLEACRNAGIMYIPSMIYAVADTRHAAKAFKNDWAASSAKLREIVLKLKGDPALLAWYTCDESQPQELAAHRRATDFIHGLDPDHPVYFVLDRPERVRHFTAAFDVIGMDPYPVGNNRGGIDIAYGWADEAKKGMYGFRPMWHVNQAYNWGWHQSRKAQVGKNPDLHFPTREEYSSMMWQAVAAGANGLVPYAFHHLLRDAKDREESERLVKMVFEEMSEVRRHFDVLLSPPGPAVRGAPEGLAVRTWNQDGRVWLLACNKTRSPLAATFRLDGAYEPAGRSVGAGGVCSGKTVSVDLPPIGFTLFSLVPRREAALNQEGA